MPAVRGDANLFFMIGVQTLARVPLVRRAPMQRRLLLAAAAAMTFVPFAVLAADVPSDLAGAKLVTAAEVEKLAGTGALIVDARVASEYADSHIKGAISIPYREKSIKDVGLDAAQASFHLGKLPPDKHLSIVVYCNGPDCWKSFKASTLAIRDGYTNIHWYRGGFPDWKA